MTAKFIAIIVAAFGVTLAILVLLGQAITDMARAWMGG